MAKLYDLAVAVGSYTNRAGEEKKRWKNIGSVVETKDGGKVILLDRTFNPAGIDVEPGRDQIMISMFKPRESEPREPEGEQPAARSASAPAQKAQANDFIGIDDDIPF